MVEPSAEKAYESAALRLSRLDIYVPSFCLICDKELDIGIVYVYKVTVSN